MREEGPERRARPRAILAWGASLALLVAACGVDQDDTERSVRSSDSTGVGVPHRLLGFRMVDRSAFRLEFRVNGALQETSSEDGGAHVASISLPPGQPFEISVSWFGDGGFGEPVEVARFRRSFEGVPGDGGLSISSDDYDYEIDDDGDRRPNLAEIEDGTNPGDSSSFKPSIGADAVTRIFLRWFNTADYDVQLVEPDGAIVVPDSVFGRWTHSGEQDGATDFSEDFNSEIIFVTGGTPLPGLHTVTVTKFGEADGVGVDGFYVGCCGDRGDDPLDPGGFVLDSFAFDFVGRDILEVGESFTFTFFVE